MKTLLSKRLRAAREAMQPAVTQRDVAKRLELHPSTVNLWEAGKTEPKTEHLAELSRWFQVPVEWLLGIESTAPGATGKNLDIYTVPVVKPRDLIAWHWEKVTELLQTSHEYPTGTAVGVQSETQAMAETCPPGSYIVINKGALVRPGDVVMATVPGSEAPVVRKLLQEGGDRLLLADDQRFPAFRVDEGVRIIGRVCEVTIRRTM